MIMGGSASMESMVGQEVDKMRPEVLVLLQQLIGCRTESQDPANLHYLAEADRCLDMVEALLVAAGSEIVRWDAGPTSFPRHPVLAGLVRGGGSGPSMTLSGHIDVVPAGDLSAWSVDPWAGQVHDGKVYGRGACDMKGGVAAMLTAVTVLSRLGVRLGGDVWVHVVSDEEVVGRGSRECVQRLARTEAVVDPEPTGLRIVPVEGGLEHFRIEVDGRSTHAGQRWTYMVAGGQGTGVSAIDKMIKIVNALYELERIWSREAFPMFPPGFNSLMPGIMVGGPGGGSDGQLLMVTNPGTTPNYCSVEYNLWYYPDRTFDDVRQEIEMFVDHVCQTDPWLREHPPRFTWHLRNIHFPPVNAPADHSMVQCLAGRLREMGRTAEPTAFSAVCDLAWYVEQGMPGVVFGPGDLRQAHSPDEFVPLDEVLDAAKVIALSLMTWCGWEGGDGRP